MFVFVWVFFCLAVSNEASLPAQKAQIFHRTETSAQMLHHPRLNATLQLFPVGDDRKLTQRHHAGEQQSQNQTRTSRPDCITLPPLLTLFTQTLTLTGNLTPSPRQLHMAEGERKMRNNSSSRRQLQSLNFHHLHAVLPNKAPP